ncbi:MAG TPA: hypothetical protein VH858_08580, partial [Hyphomicrobiales bacterium]
MRTDERIEAAIQDPDDVRSLLLSATAAETASLRDLAVPRDRKAGVDRIADAIERLIEAGLPGGDKVPQAPLFRLAAWAARRLGSTAKTHDLAEADGEIVRLSKNGAADVSLEGPELRFPEGGDTTLLQIAVGLARLRQRKTRHLRWWRPLLDRLVGHPTPAPRAPANVPATRSESREVGEARPDGDVLWDVIRNAGGRLPLSVWEEKLNEARKAIGRFNIIVAGRTGVGKTTLIGAIFGEE